MLPRDHKEIGRLRHEISDSSAGQGTAGEQVHGAVWPHRHLLRRDEGQGLPQADLYNEELGIRFFLAKASDVPTYVEYGAADIGVVGKDTILEEGRKLYEVMNLGLGNCRMCVCGPKEAEELLKHHERIRVATKYPAIAKDYFYNKKHQTVEIIKLNGSIELAPIVGLSEVIVDIVETGTTLKENGLRCWRRSARCPPAWWSTR